LDFQIAPRFLSGRWTPLFLYFVCHTWWSACLEPFRLHIINIGLFIIVLEVLL
jgi:hypothetical protein